MRSTRKEKEILAMIEKTVAVEQLACEAMLKEDKDERLMQNISDKLDCLHIITKLIQQGRQNKKSNLHKVLIQDSFAIMNGFGDYDEKSAVIMQAIQNTVEDINNDKKIKKDKKSEIVLPLMQIVADFHKQKLSNQKQKTIDVKLAQRKSTRMFALKLPGSEESSPRSEGSQRAISSPEDSHDDTDKSPKGNTPK